MADAATAAPPAAAAAVVDEERGVAFRPATPADVPAMRRLFDRTFPIKYDSRFYDLLEQGIDRGSMHGVAGQLLCAVAERAGGGGLAGAVVMHTMDVSAAKAAGQLTFDLVEGQRPATLAAYILLLAVDPASRRTGIGSDLIYHGSLMLGGRLSAQEGEALSAVSRPRRRSPARIKGGGGGELAGARGAAPILAPVPVCCEAQQPPPPASPTPARAHARRSFATARRTTPPPTGCTGPSSLRCSGGYPSTTRSTAPSTLRTCGSWRCRAPTSSGTGRTSTASP